MEYYAAKLKGSHIVFADMKPSPRYIVHWEKCKAQNWMYPKWLDPEREKNTLVEKLLQPK